MSELSWTDGVPSRYRVVRLGSVVREVRQRNAGMRSENLLSLSYGSVVRKDILSRDGLLPESFETYNLIAEGDVVLRLTDLQNDKRSLRSGLVREDGIITSAYTTLRPVSVEARFFAYQMRAIDLAKTLYSLGGGLRQSLGYDDMKTLAIALPSGEEQRQIADYLDHETAEIDAFIADLESLTTKLEEHRMAELASLLPYPSDLFRADSSTVVPLRHLGTISLGKMLDPKPTTKDSEYPYLRAANIQPLGRLDLSDVKTMRFSPSERVSLDVRQGDVMIVEGGQGGFGRAAYAREALPGVGFQNSIVRVRPFRGVDGRFITYALHLLRHAGYIRTVASVTSMPHFTAEKVAVAPIPIADAERQRSVADALDARWSEIDASVADIDAAIALAKERRAALITAAVTGQMDVTAKGTYL